MNSFGNMALSFLAGASAVAIAGAGAAAGAGAVAGVGSTVVTSFSSNMKNTGTSLDATKCIVTNDGTDIAIARSPDFKTAGKFYFEVYVSALGVSNNWRIGIANWKFFNTTGGGGIFVGDKYAVIGNNSSAPTSQVFTNSGNTNFGSTWANGDILQVAVDLDGGTVKFAQNNGAYSSTVSLTGFGPIAPLIQQPASSSASCTARFSSSSWTYSPPTGYGEWSTNSTYTGRYWRWQTWLGGGTRDGQTIAEMSMKLTSGGSNQCSGGTASASTEFSPPTYSAAKALDGNASTMWGSNAQADVAWWQYDFGSGVTKDIREYTYSIRNDGYIQYARGFALLYSDDATNWKLAEFRSAETWTSGQSKTFSAGP